MGDRTLETFNPRHEIDVTKIYKVDFFLRRWKDVNPNCTFLPGGRYFVASGKSLKAMIERSFSLEEGDEQEVVTKRKKKDVCFLKILYNRRLVYEQYRKLFYSRPNARTEEAFKNLYIRPRNKRYSNRQSFSYLIVKQLQCKNCQNQCVYEALKRFYMMDSKCVAEVDNLVTKERLQND
ncbi:lef-2 [Matsumuraeses phaseoli granulovirus]|uniref:Lef-2 n=1 Tax=Matsumuraeses phaseoli granulovirus TaxID=2760664 RepID=A0AAE7MLB9_9BBAC|nr:lef-2 [Matsumuraeses phaseoli granulovirus]QOD39997.1 lef-2 [Matsumuraeses phaseoli granulovirus]